MAKSSVIPFTAPSATPVLPWDVLLLIVDFADDETMKALYITSSDLRHRSAWHVWHDFTIGEGESWDRISRRLQLLAQPWVLPYVRCLILDVGLPPPSSTQADIIETLFVPLGNTLTQSAIISISFKSFENLVGMAGIVFFRWFRFPSTLKSLTFNAPAHTAIQVLGRNQIPPELVHVGWNNQESSRANEVDEDNVGGTWSSLANIKSLAVANPTLLGLGTYSPSLEDVSIEVASVTDVYFIAQLQSLQHFTFLTQMRINYLIGDPRNMFHDQLSHLSHLRKLMVAFPINIRWNPEIDLQAIMMSLGQSNLEEYICLLFYSNLPSSTNLTDQLETMSGTFFEWLATPQSEGILVSLKRVSVAASELDSSAPGRWPVLVARRDGSGTSASGASVSRWSRSEHVFSAGMQEEFRQALWEESF
jgi:hypothetical protein